MAREGELLVIEDELALASLMRRYFQAMGFRVRAEQTGAAGLLYAAESPPELVILDLRLPDMSGYEVCRKLRQMFPPWSLPIVMFTGLDEPVDQLRGMAHGADAYLTKPCDMTELLKTVSFLLGEKALHAPPAECGGFTPSS